jgi:threonine/homoserine/homoserine lactone efflux protein
VTPSGLLGLIATMLALAVVPGPAQILFVAHTVSRGRRAGAASVAGVLVADYVLIAIALLMLEMAITVSEHGWRALGLIGVAYLSWTGVRLWLRAGVRIEPGSARTRASFVDGLLVTLADPKAVLFYLALLPAFLGEQATTEIGVLAIAAAATLAVSAAGLIYVLLAARLKRVLERPGAFKAVNRLAAALLVLVGSVLAYRLF